jgi:molybdate transport system ATP-binding protein
LLKHTAIYISNLENKKELLWKITSGMLFPEIQDLKEGVLSDIALNKFIEEEIRYGLSHVQTKTRNSLKNSSEGERKKALLNHILKCKPEYVLLDNIFDCLDVNSQSDIRNKLFQLQSEFVIIQITTRKRDVLPFIDVVYSYEKGALKLYSHSLENKNNYFISHLPKPYKNIDEISNPLISLRDINLCYGERQILRNISWEIKPNQFWQLAGPNGSGKSTILSLISGDNPKGYLQDMTLFGMRKGSGESVWDIKKHIGFFSSEMLLGFKRSDTIESMIISGFLDSIGLYKYPTDIQINIAHKWLGVLNMYHIKDKSFQSLPNGHKRLVLIARAMVKHPSLLILDEPTNGLDDNDAVLLAELVNKISKETNTAILYVSHRKEECINPDYIFELIPSQEGSTGRILQ